MMFWGWAGSECVSGGGEGGRGGRGCGRGRESQIILSYICEGREYFFFQRVVSFFLFWRGMGVVNSFAHYMKMYAVPHVVINDSSLSKYKETNGILPAFWQN